MIIRFILVSLFIPVMMTCEILFLLLQCLLIIIVNDCSSSTLLDRLRKHKTITFQSSLSSPLEFTVNEGSKFRLTCSFLSNFDKIDIFWFYNGTLLQSFISKVRHENLEKLIFIILFYQTIEEEEDDNVEQSFLAVTIVSTIEIEKTHCDMQGAYLCVAVHHDIYAQQTFNVHVVANGKTFV